MSTGAELARQMASRSRVEPRGCGDLVGALSGFQRHGTGMSALATADELAAEAPDPDDYEWPESAEGDEPGDYIDLVDANGDVVKDANGAVVKMVQVLFDNARDYMTRWRSTESPHPRGSTRLREAIWRASSAPVDIDEAGSRYTEA